MIDRENVADINEDNVPMENKLAGVDDKGAPLSKVPRFMDYVDSDSDREEVEPTHELDKYLALRVPKAKGVIMV